MKNLAWLCGICVLGCLPASAQLLDVKGELSTNDLAPRSFSFTSSPGQIVVSLRANTRPGTVTFDILGPDGARLGQQSAGVFTMDGWLLSVTNAGVYKLEVRPHATAGTWRVRIDALPPIRALYTQCGGGMLMILVATGSVLGWWWKARVPWRWFWAGAGIWTVGVVLKFAVAIPLNPRLFAGLGQITGWKLVWGSIYSGLMTGVFEIGITLAAALVWRRMAAEANRAVAVGLGAGAFEALLLGLGGLAGPLVALAVGQGDTVLKSLAPTFANTPVLWLAGPVERVITILVHTASRVLVLRAVASHRWLGFWVGFAWLSAIDLVAGAALLSGLVASRSVWWIELCILPFGILSLPLIRSAVREWPAELPVTAPAAAQPGLPTAASPPHAAG